MKARIGTDANKLSKLYGDQIRVKRVEIFKSFEQNQSKHGIQDEMSSKCHVTSLRVTSCDKEKTVFYF